MKQYEKIRGNYTTKVRKKWEKQSKHYDPYSDASLSLSADDWQCGSKREDKF